MQKQKINTKIVKVFILGLVCLNFFLGQVQIVYAQVENTGVEDSIRDFLCTPTVTDGAKEKVKGNSLTDPKVSAGAVNSDLMTCINRLYRFAIVAASISAVFLFVWAGYLYMSDSGNEKMVGTAKDIMGTTVIGLIILVSTYIMLRFLNPELVNIPNFQPAAVSDVPSDSGGLEPPRNPTSTPPSGGPSGNPGQLPPGGKCLGSKCPAPSSFKPPLYDLNNDGINCKNNCFINPAYASKVKALKAYLDSNGGPALRITEAYPPTSNHQSNSHYNGNTIDISPATKTVENFNKYCKALKAVGLTSFLNEASNEAKDCGSSRKTKFGTGPHIHVNLY